MEKRTNKIKVGLVQINNSFSGQNYFPYSVGLLQGYFMENSKLVDNFEFLSPIYKRIKVEKAVESLIEADIIGFSIYVWNERISLEIARQLKERKPQMVIVFGGPQVPDKSESFLMQNRFINLAVHGEGELVFKDILENLINNSLTSIPSTSYINESGKYVINPKSGKIGDLSKIPSPYLNGVFDKLMLENPDEQWLVMWETNRGCPYTCTFCDWGSATASKVFKFDLERLYKEIEWFGKTKIEFIFCCDSNFGMLARDLDIAKKVAEVKSKYNYPQALSVQNTKNATDKSYAVQKVLADSGLNKGVTISMQSIDTETLISIRRQNISTDSFRELQRRFTIDKIETYTDLILALPGETFNSFMNGLSRIIEEGQHNRIQFNNLSILPNAEMGDPEYQKKYGMKIVPSDIINIHGSLNDSSWEIKEVQQLVVATNSLPEEDWIKARSISWMVALLHFDKILQFPFVVFHEFSQVSYREIFEHFMYFKDGEFPIFEEVRNFFIDKALNIQSGGLEYCGSTDWLNIYWPADEYILIKLITEDKLSKLYDESYQLLQILIKLKNVSIDERIIKEAIYFNCELMKMPFQKEDKTVQLNFNLWEFYRLIIHGERIPLVEGKLLYKIDKTSLVWNSWDDYFKEVIWYGNKKGAYLYANKLIENNLDGSTSINQAIETQIAGHF